MENNFSYSNYNLWKALCSTHQLTEDNVRVKTMAVATNFHFIFKPQTELHILHTVFLTLYNLQYIQKIQYSIPVGGREYYLDKIHWHKHMSNFLPVSSYQPALGPWNIFLSDVN
jgi:hypothetical protein